ncbi:MAG TPA: RNA polymerase sigma factor RpoH, partial [Xanthomonadaceae bacterium]|nr:RNA polymerase sigma factor RpoH [Xanthomonadaceae bacterium]
LKVSEREVLEMESRLSGRDIGFDAPAGEDDEHAPPAPIAWLEQVDADPAALFERENHEEKQLDALGEGLEGLDDRSRAILQRRFLAEEKATLQDLAAEYGVSAERVRQIEANALKKLRNALLA